ncbi:hypothetical protein EYF80_041358 [Liparis tanakae]|uniref:Uncharacterized protein n=1 Tax=Liparis tanakae TaxID=230148 RepID=A0A4Z2G794_9TELE|nr:hypothetical protein EYF80_041358 [Liparis tanakae]
MWTLVGSCGLMWTHVGSCGLMWTLVGSCGLLWAYVDSCGLMWTLVGSCGLLWAHVDSCGLMWTLVDSGLVDGEGRTARVVPSASLGILGDCWRCEVSHLGAQDFKELQTSCRPMRSKVTGQGAAPHRHRRSQSPLSMRSISSSLLRAAALLFSMSLISSVDLPAGGGGSSAWRPSGASDWPSPPRLSAEDFLAFSSASRPSSSSSSSSSSASPSATPTSGASGRPAALMAAILPRTMLRWRRTYSSPGAMASVSSRQAAARGRSRSSKYTTHRLCLPCTLPGSACRMLRKQALAPRVSLRWFMRMSPLRIRPLTWRGWCRSSSSSAGSASSSRPVCCEYSSARLKSALRKPACSPTARRIQRSAAALSPASIASMPRLK